MSCLQPATVACRWRFAFMEQYRGWADTRFRAVGHRKGGKRLIEHQRGFGSYGCSQRGIVNGRCCRLGLSFRLKNQRLGVL
jgi:hypothetical protein